MPLINDTERGLQATERALPDEPDFHPSWDLTAGAAARLSNSAVSALAEETGIPARGSKKDFTFDTWSRLNGTKYQEDYADFADADDDEEVDAIMRQKDREENDRYILGNSGMPGFMAQLATGAVDPIGLVAGIGIGGVAKSFGVTVGRTAAARGASVVAQNFANRFAMYGLMGGTALSAQEAALHATQMQRTFGESAVNITAGTLLGGLLGSAFHVVPEWQQQRLLRLMTGEDKPTFFGQKPADIPVTPEGTGSAGAAMKFKTTLEQEELVGTLGLNDIRQLPVVEQFQAADLALRNSPSVTARRIVGSLNDNRLFTEKNFEGIASPQSVETRVNVAMNGFLAKGINILDDVFVKYRMGRDRQFGDNAKLLVKDFIPGTTEGKLTRQQFYNRVAVAMRNGDKDSIPEVTAAASQLRQNVYDPLKNQAIEMGLLPKDVSPETSLSYLMRRYDHRRIAERRPEFQGRITDWLKESKTRAQESFGRAKTRHSESRSAYDNLRKQRDDLGKFKDELNEMLKEARKARGFAERDVMAAEQALREAEATAAKVAARAEQFSTGLDLTNPADLATAVKSLRSDDGLSLNLKPEELQALQNDFEQFVGAAEDLTTGQAVKKWMALRGKMRNLKDLEQQAADEFEGSTANYTAFIKQMQKPPAEPKRGPTLATFIKQQGGIKPDKLEASWVQRIVDGDRRLRGLLNAKTGKSIDDMTQAAYEQGYFPAEVTERPDINAMLDLLEQDARFGGVYKESDKWLDWRYTMDNIEEAQRLLASNGIEFEGRPPADVVADMKKANMLGDAPEPTTAGPRDDVPPVSASGDKVGGPKSRTPGNAGRLKEIAYNLRQSAKATGSKGAKAAKVRARYQDAAYAARTAAEALKEINAKLAGLEKASGPHWQSVRHNQAVMEAMRDFVGTDDGELWEIAGRVIDRIMGDTYANSPKLPSGLATPFRERTLHIPDNKILDFLDNNIERVTRQYVRYAVPDIELMRTFGDINLKSQLDDVRTEYDRLQAAAKSPDEVKRLEGLRQRDVASIIGLTERLRGSFGMPADPHAKKMTVLRDAERFMLDYNHVTSLGSATVASLADPFKVVLYHGMGRAFKPLLAVIQNGFKPVAKAVAKEARGAGLMFEAQVHSRAQAFAEVTDMTGMHSKFVQGFNAFSNTFSRVNLLSPWTDLMHGLATGPVGDMLLEFSAKAAAGKAAGKEGAELARLGIDSPMAARIAKEFEAHGDTMGGMRIANYADWTDRGAAEAFTNAMNQDVRQIIVTPGQDRPLLMSRPGWRLVSQFWAYNVSAYNQTLMYGLQKRDASVLAGMTMMIGAGALIYYIRSYQRGIEPSDDPLTVMTEAVDYSGLLGWLFQVNDTLEKATGNRAGLRAMLGTETNTRYYNVNALGALLGPSAGKVQDAAELMGDAASGNVDSGTIRDLRRMIPFQNLFYTRWLFDKAEQGAAEAMGFKFKGSGQGSAVRGLSTGGTQ